jgi:hypothetical protein
MTSPTLPEVIDLIADYETKLAKHRALHIDNYASAAANRAEDEQAEAFNKAEDALSLFLMDHPKELIEALRHGVER